ncbi:MAG: hypothetical protein LWX09_12555 [Bacteroidia bacterium]|nr:hypothetical protein [Bacteroidia bacterium]
MAQFDLHFVRNDAASGIQFSEAILGKPTSANQYLTQDPVSGALSWQWADWSHITGKPSTFNPSAHGHAINDIANLQTSLDAKLSTSLKGVANGLAELDATGKVPASQLPSYVDDVLEYANLAAFPGSGEQGKIYTAIDTNKIYRWSGSAYIEISPTAGNADTATKLATARSIASTGDATWSVSFDGSANVSAALTLASSGVTAGTYPKVTVDAKGRVIAGASLAASDVPSLDAAKITSGSFDAARIPSLDAAKITSGTFADARIPNLAISKITNLQTELDARHSWRSAPADSTAVGSAGQMAYSANYLYICVGTNAWRRLPMANWSGAGS